MEKSPEIASGHSSTYFRELDSRLGRWWAVDPVTHSWQSPYSTFDNNPVYYADPMGSSVVNPEGKGPGCKSNGVAKGGGKGAGAFSRAMSNIIKAFSWGSKTGTVQSTEAFGPTGTLPSASSQTAPSSPGSPSSSSGNGVNGGSRGGGGIGLGGNTSTQSWLLRALNWTFKRAGVVGMVLTPTSLGTGDIPITIHTSPLVWGSPASGTGTSTKEEDEERERYVFRVMAPDPKMPCQPEAANPCTPPNQIVARQLGAREGDVQNLLNPDGTVSPNLVPGSGMSASVAPIIPAPHMKPKIDNGNLKIWKIKVKYLGAAGLLVHYDGYPLSLHAGIVPGKKMSLEEYQARIIGTQGQWELYDPITDGPILPNNTFEYKP